MHRKRIPLLAIASAGILLSTGTFAEEPPFQNNPGAPRPSPPAEAPTPVFTEQGSESTSPSPAPAAAPPSLSPSPMFGRAEGPAIAAPSAPPPEAPSPIAPRLMPIDSSTAPALAAPPPRSARAAPKKRPVAVQQVTPRRKKERDRSQDLGPSATFPGFRMLDGGGSRVFVKLSGKVGITEHKAEGQLVYRLQGASVPSRTNRLPLDTSFFLTPVSQVKLVPRGGDADLVIELKQASDAQHRIEEQRDGLVLIVDFPRALANVTPSAPEFAEPDRAKRSTRTTRIGGGSEPGM